MKNKAMWVLYGVAGWFAILVVGNIIAQDIFNQQSFDDLAEYTARQF